ncbi:hypothetical protein Lpp22_0982 [Lacticaseibacillus paracasei subsp. paracasei Lpp22]|uniref:UPF0298 protein Lpp22_0982 n=2 Tax=Lacticaseibacillus paracasei subsp. paracasei TaxID=47714 RepID=A0A8E0IB74_LACPA|nr:putative cytosolic protein [Lacticaseibacillus casei UW4]EKQ22247.1 putative cytosolic protein [Lacticaseibacillus paracasei]EPC30937.1 hypothetical protein Lpp22_0982 [Lacticaseibacillus paracasei subsp. paracasei Lpp22]
MEGEKMFAIKQRQGLVVWVYSLKQLKTLRRYGTIMYVSRRMKYVYLYLDQDELAQTSAKLSKLRFVKRVEPSHRPELATEFGSNIGQFKPTEEDLEVKAKPKRRLRPSSAGDETSVGDHVARH